MKKVKIVLITAIGVLLLAGCGKSSKTTVIDLKVSPQVTETPKPTKAPENPNAVKTNGDYTATNEYLMNHKGEAIATPSSENKNTNPTNKNTQDSKNKNENNQNNQNNTQNDNSQNDNNDDGQNYDNGDQSNDNGNDGSDDSGDNGNYDDGNSEDEGEN